MFFRSISLFIGGLFNGSLKGSDYILSGQFLSIEFDTVWRKNYVSYFGVCSFVLGLEESHEMSQS